MTFNTSAWAIDGALMSSSLARRQTYALAQNIQGVVNATDFKVSALATPGSGVRIAGGVGLVLNRYQSNINETYVVSNADTHTVASADMPVSSSAERYFILGVAIGDPSPGFSQAGHPFMTTVPAGQENTYSYVRPVFVEGTSSTVAPNVGFPFLPLARIRIPANTTTITDSLITDLRRVAQPRSKTVILTALATAGSLPQSGSNIGWPAAASFGVPIPEWATTAKVIGFIEGARVSKAYSANVAVELAGVGTTTTTNLVETDVGTNNRRTINVGGEIAIPAANRGSAGTVRVVGRALNANSNNVLSSDTSTSIVLQVVFEENPA